MSLGHHQLPDCGTAHPRIRIGSGGVGREDDRGADPDAMAGVLTLSPHRQGTRRSRRALDTGAATAAAVQRNLLAAAHPRRIPGTADHRWHYRRWYPSSSQLPDLIPMYLYLFGTWEPDLVAFLRRRLRPGETFVDVGANIGCVSALASRLVGPRGTVVAIEPSPPMIAALQETLTRNDLTNVRMVTAAVSDHDQELPLFAGPSAKTA